MEIPLFASAFTEMTKKTTTVVCKTFSKYQYSKMNIEYQLNKGGKKNIFLLPSNISDSESGWNLGFSKNISVYPRFTCVYIVKNQYVIATSS